MVVLMTSFPFTWLRWYNSAEGNKVASADVGVYENIPFGTARQGEVHANGKPPHPEFGQWQWGISCSRTSRTLVIDVDDYAAYKLSDLELVLPVDQATSFRVSGETLKLHFVVIVPENLLHLWPRQGATPWGDIKSNGFSYITGVHYTGTLYQATQCGPVVADEELLLAVNAEPRAQVHGANTGGSAGSWSEPGYAYPDGAKHTRGVADVASMVNQGMPDIEIKMLMTEILQRSEGYTGRGEEVAGWIDSARRKYNLAEGESRADQQAAEHINQLRFILGDETFAAVESRTAAAIAEWEKSQAPLAYLRDKQSWFSALQPVPDLSLVPLENLFNSTGEAIEPAGSSDSFLAELFLAYTREILVLAADSGCWLRDYGHVWRQWGSKSDARDYAKTALMAWAKNLKTRDQVEAEVLACIELSDDADPVAVADDERVKRISQVRQRLTSSAGISAVAELAVAAARESKVFEADLDAEPWVIWAGGRPWSLLHPELTVAENVSPRHLKNCAVAPEPGPHPLWDEALAALFPDPGVREWAVREIAGACLWGATSKEHPVLDGKPNAGKSTVTDTIRKVLGNYAVDIDPNKLIGGTDNSSTEEEKAAMIGARMVLLDEPPKRDRQSISQFNRIASGTGEIAASAKYKGRVSAAKRFNMVINQNPRNRMKLEAEGVRQRLVFIPAEGHIPVGLYQKFMRGIQAEYPAILATLIRECALFHTGHRLPVPLAAQIALDAAYAEGDEFPQWLWERYDKPAGKPTGHEEDTMPGLDSLRISYAEHARTLQGVSQLTRTQLRERLAELGVEVKDHGGSNGKRHNVVLLKPLPAAQAIFIR